MAPLFISPPGTSACGQKCLTSGRCWAIAAQFLLPFPASSTRPCQHSKHLDAATGCEIGAVAGQLQGPSCRFAQSAGTGSASRRLGIWGWWPGTQGLREHGHSQRQPHRALHPLAFISTALSPAPPVSLWCLRTAGCFFSLGPYLLLICNCKQLFIIAHLQPLRPPCPPSAAPHCP